MKRRALLLPLTAAEFSTARWMSPPAMPRLVQQIEQACRDARGKHVDLEAAITRLLRACIRYLGALAEPAETAATTARIRGDAPVGAQQTASAPDARPPQVQNLLLDAIESGLEELDPMRITGYKVTAARPDGAHAGGKAQQDKSDADPDNKKIFAEWDRLRELHPDWSAPRVKARVFENVREKLLNKDLSAEAMAGRIDRRTKRKKPRYRRARPVRACRQA